MQIRIRAGKLTCIILVALMTITSYAADSDYQNLDTDENGQVSRDEARTASGIGEGCTDKNGSATVWTENFKAKGEGGELIEKTNTYTVDETGKQVKEATTQTDSQVSGTQNFGGGEETITTRREPTTVLEDNPGENGTKSTVVRKDEVRDTEKVTISTDDGVVTVTEIAVFDIGDGSNKKGQTADKKALKDEGSNWADWINSDVVKDIIKPGTEGKTGSTEPRHEPGSEETETRVKEVNHYVINRDNSTDNVYILIDENGRERSVVYQEGSDVEYEDVLQYYEWDVCNIDNKEEFGDYEYHLLGRYQADSGKTEHTFRHYGRHYLRVRPVYTRYRWRRYYEQIVETTVTETGACIEHVIGVNEYTENLPSQTVCGEYTEYGPVWVPLVCDECPGVYICIGDTCDCDTPNTVTDEELPITIDGRTELVK